MHKILILKGEVAVVLFLLFVLQACSYHTIEQESPPINEIKAGEKFTIILPENHSEHFIWKLSEQRNSTVIEYVNAVWHGNDKGIYYNFKAVKTGTDTCHFTQLKLKDTTRLAEYIVKAVN